jgi:hypothetical protein
MSILPVEGDIRVVNDTYVATLSDLKFVHFTSCCVNVVLCVHVRLCFRYFSNIGITHATNAVSFFLLPRSIITTPSGFSRKANILKFDQASRLKC